MPKNFFAVSSMLKGVNILGELPDTKRAYGDVTAVALPSVAEMVLMSLIGSVDTMMVGALGPEAIAAVGLCGQPRMLLLSIFFALNVGVTAIVARRKGEGRQGDANRTLRNAIMLVLGLSILIMIPAFLFSRPLLQFAGAQADTIAMSQSYFDILAYFLPINALTMCICAAQRGVGNTRITMYVNTASNLVNVLFNYLLIGGNLGFPKMGVAGAALATGIGFAVGFVMCIVTIVGSRNGGFLRITRHDNWRPDLGTISGIVKVGGNAVLEQIALRIGFFAYAKIVAGLGTMVFAAHQIGMQFLNISFSFGDGIGVAGTALVGQMLGMKRPDKAVIYGKVSQRMAFVVAICIAAIVLIFRYPLVGLFTEDPQVLVLAAQVMLMVALFQPFQTSSVVISGCLRGAGDTKYVAYVMMLCVAVIRPILSLLAVYVIQNVMHLPEWALLGCWGASIVDMTVRLTAVYRRFNSGKWHNIVV